MSWQRLWFIPSLAMLGVLAWVAADRWASLPDGEQLPGLTAGLIAVALHLGANVLLSFGWHRQIVLAGNPVAFAPTAAVWSSGQLSRFLVPGAAFGARAILAKRLGVSAATGAATTVFELGWTLLAHPVIVLLALPFWADLPDSLRWLAFGAVVPVCMLVALVAAPARAVHALASVLRRLPMIGRRVPEPERLAAAELRPRDAAALAGIHLGNVSLRHLAFVVLLASTTSLDGAGVAAVVGASALGRFVGLIAVFAPAGLGPREGITVLALAP
ncbi:MAG: hypothetical protein ACI867_001659, partial [Glaciecola sp.]